MWLKHNCILSLVYPSCVSMRSVSCASNFSPGLLFEQFQERTIIVFCKAKCVKITNILHSVCGSSCLCGFQRDFLSLGKQTRNCRLCAWHAWTSTNNTTNQQVTPFTFRREEAVQTCKSRAWNQCHAQTDPLCFTAIMRETSCNHLLLQTSLWGRSLWFILGQLGAYAHARWRPLRHPRVHSDSFVFDGRVDKRCTSAREFTKMWRKCKKVARVRRGREKETERQQLTSQGISQGWLIQCDQRKILIFK